VRRGEDEEQEQEEEDCSRGQSKEWQFDIW